MTSISPLAEEGGPVPVLSPRSLAGLARHAIVGARVQRIDGSSVCRDALPSLQRVSAYRISDCYAVRYAVRVPGGAPLIVENLSLTPDDVDAIRDVPIHSVCSIRSSRNCLRSAQGRWSEHWSTPASTPGDAIDIVRFFRRGR